MTIRAYPLTPPARIINAKNTKSLALEKKKVYRPQWEREINTLMKDFGFSKAKREEIIAKTKEKAMPGDDGKKMYRRGHGVFMVELDKKFNRKH